MKRAITLLPVVLGALLLPAPALHALSPLSTPLSAFTPEGQRRDPLNENESDQIRELADQPDKRIELFVKFINARFDAIQQMQGDPRLAAGRGTKVHDLLQDITALVDELDDNIDDYVDRKQDVRKALKAVVEADTSYQLKLRTFKEQTSASKEYGEYNFVLQDAIDAVNGSLDDARQALDDLEKILKEEKKKK